MISTKVAAKLSGFTKDNIVKRLRNGDIEGVKIGRDWWTTREAVLDYLQKERHPGPKPKKRTGR